jgi:acyl dehydratase
VRVRSDADAENKLHHEDLEIANAISCGRREITGAEILAFAHAYGEAPADAPRGVPVGALSASPIHVCAIMMRMVCDGILNRAASLGSPGVDRVRWLRPVHAGEVVETRYTPLAKRVLASRPDVGLTKVLVELLEAGGEPLATWDTNQLTRVRWPQARPPRPPGERRSAVVNLWDGHADTRSIATGEGFFEDYAIGTTLDLGRAHFAAAEMKAFAREFDPQPFHLDEAAARASLFGALSATGWLTLAHLARRVARRREGEREAARRRGLTPARCGPPPGLEDLRWPVPVLVGDTVEFRCRLAQKVCLPAPAAQGLLVWHVEGRKQTGQSVLHLTARTQLERRGRA